jgi:hypothetical protein
MQCASPLLEWCRVSNSFHVTCRCCNIFNSYGVSQMEKEDMLNAGCQYSNLPEVERG